MVSTGHGSVEFTETDKELWLKFRQENGITDEPTEADIWHSDLLARIAKGGPVFVTPPPLSYSYPWVNLMLEGWSESVGFEEPYIWKSKQSEDPGNGKLMLAQYPWTIEEEYIPEHGYSKEGWERLGKKAWRVNTRGLTAFVEWGGIQRSHALVAGPNRNWEGNAEPMGELCYGIWLEGGPQPQILLEKKLTGNK
jgi:hypothetical protein